MFGGLRPGTVQQGERCEYSFKTFKEKCRQVKRRQMEDSFNVKLGCIYNQITLECGSENVWLFVSPLAL